MSPSGITLKPDEKIILDAALRHAIDLGDLPFEQQTEVQGLRAYLHGHHHVAGAHAALATLLLGYAFQESTFKPGSYAGLGRDLFLRLRDETPIEWVKSRGALGQKLAPGLFDPSFLKKRVPRFREDFLETVSLNAGERHLLHHAIYAANHTAWHLDLPAEIKFHEVEKIMAMNHDLLFDEASQMYQFLQWVRENQVLSVNWGHPDLIALKDKLLKGHQTFQFWTAARPLDDYLEYGNDAAIKHDAELAITIFKLGLKAVEREPKQGKKPHVEIMLRARLSDLFFKQGRQSDSLIHAMWVLEHGADFLSKTPEWISLLYRVSKIVKDTGFKFESTLVDMLKVFREEILTGVLSSPQELDIGNLAHQNLWKEASFLLQEGRGFADPIKIREAEEKILARVKKAFLESLNPKTYSSEPLFVEWIRKAFCKWNPKARLVDHGNNHVIISIPKSENYSDKGFWVLDFKMDIKTQGIRFSLLNQMQGQLPQLMSFLPYSPALSRMNHYLTCLSDCIPELFHDFTLEVPTAGKTKMLMWKKGGT